MPGSSTIQGSRKQLHCTYCEGTTHTIEKCFYLIGFPIGHALHGKNIQPRNRSQKITANQTGTDSLHNKPGQTPAQSLQLTAEELSQIKAFLQEKSIVSANYSQDPPSQTSLPIIPPKSHDSPNPPPLILAPSSIKNPITSSSDSPTTETLPSPISSSPPSLAAPPVLHRSHFGAGNSKLQHQHAPASTSTAVVPLEILSSDEESEVEESSSCDSDAYSSNSSDLGPVDVPISSFPATNGASSPSSRRAPAEGSGAVVPPSALIDAAAEIANRVDFASSSSDPMIPEVAAAVREWVIVKKKKHNNINVQQAVAKGVGSAGVGSAVPLDSGMVSR
ncbi:hypothetical protein DKX38_024537 [Salix brachista]|uniref:Uncharacterized protein n=1 Tax=Salix brachista TaxID=2182728 RepID=A0A5N5JLL6_9ROSI|nr:hypothetical protein DKX38_024537 [Salix brachista]